MGNSSNCKNLSHIKYNDRTVDSELIEPLNIKTTDDISSNNINSSYTDKKFVAQTEIHINKCVDAIKELHQNADIYLEGIRRVNGEFNFKIANYENSYALMAKKMIDLQSQISELEKKVSSVDHLKKD